MKTPTFPPPSESGFTLIEMLVVLTILGLVAGFGARSMSRGPDRFSREQAGLKIEVALARAAADARASRRETRFDPRTVSAGATADSALVLYPDGSTSGGTISLDGRPLLSIDWLTGEAARAE